MCAREETDGTLVVTHDSAVLTACLIALALVLGGTAACDRFLGPRGTDRLGGLLAGAVTCFVAGLVQLERGRFVFDPHRRTVDWDRRWGLRRRRGALPFDRIAAVTVETPVGDDGVPSRRIVLRPIDGRPLPITVGYASDGADAVPRLADRIRTVLGHAIPTPAESAAMLADAGRTIDAIRLLRREQGLSLTEAKKRADALRASR